MSKKSDDSIERIFRQAVTHYDTTFRESDWLKMEKMLDEEANRSAAIRSKRRRGTAFSLIGLLGLIGSVYFLAFNHRSDSVARLNHSETEMQAAGDLGNNGDVKKETPSAGLLSLETQEDSTLPQTDKSRELQRDEISKKSEGAAKSAPRDQNSSAENLSHQRNSRDIITGQEKKPKPSSTLGKRLDQDKPALPVLPQDDTVISNKTTLSPVQDAVSKEINDSISVDSKINSLSSSDAAQNPKIPHDASNADPGGNIPKEEFSKASQPFSTQNGHRTPPDSKSEITMADSAAQNLDAGRTHEALNAPNKSMAKKNELAAFQIDSAAIEKTLPAVLPIRVDSLNDVNEVPETTPKIKPLARWSVGVVFAPEFSTTRLSHYSTPGESLGLRIGYQLSNRFNISTGIIRSTKKYKDDGSEYSPNPDYWKNRTNGVIPEEIDSKCLVYEIPLDVQFNIIATVKSRLYASTGISSYIMQSQSYQYNFETPNPGAATGWKSSGSESYWFSVGMIAAGYERNIHRALAIGIEPYLKISLAEIGWPNIKLFSTGAYVTLRYKFITRENRMLSPK